MKQSKSVADRQNEAPTKDQASMSLQSSKRLAGVYVIAVFFSAVWLFSVGSLVYVFLFKLTPEMRRHLSLTPALASLGLADLNLSLTVVASWLLVAMRRIGAGLLLASTVLIAGLCAMSWPALIHIYLRHPSNSPLRPLLMAGGNLLVHIAATVYALRLNSKGLLR